MGGSPKAPPAPPDPAIAAEKARREAIAIGLADAKRTARFGTNSTITSKDGAGGTKSRRPDQDIAVGDVSLTAESQANAAADALDLEASQLSDTTSDGNDLGSNANPTKTRLEKEAADLRAGISPADKAESKALTKDNAIANFINRKRKVVSTKTPVGGIKV